LIHCIPIILEWIFQWNTNTMQEIAWMYDFFIIYDFYKSQLINIILLMNEVYGTYGMLSYFDYIETFTFILGIHIINLVIIETSLIYENEINPYIYIYYNDMYKKKSWYLLPKKYIQIEKITWCLQDWSNICACETSEQKLNNINNQDLLFLHSTFSIKPISSMVCLRLEYLQFQKSYVSHCGSVWSIQ